MINTEMILMVRKCLSYLLIAMIALQSVGAIVADDHQPHQDDNQHLEFDHEHPSNTVNETANTTEESTSYPGIEFDCHHCCHCHNLSHFAVLPRDDSSNLALLYPMSDEFYTQYISNWYSPELRPPIV